MLEGDSEARAAATQGPSGMRSGAGYSHECQPTWAVRWPQPRKRMSPTHPGGPKPRPAPWLAALRCRSRLESAALPAMAEVMTVAAESRHRVPVKGSPSVLLGPGSRGPGPPNCPGLSLRGLTAACARPVSMATGLSRRGPRQWGCPAAPDWLVALAVGSAGGLGFAGLSGRPGASGWAGSVRSTGNAGGPAADWAPGPAAWELSWRGGTGRRRRLLLLFFLLLLLLLLLPLQGE